MKVALAQLNPTVGALKANQEKMLAMLQQAQQEGVEIVVFPELSLPGYPPLDLLERPTFATKCLAYQEELIEKMPEGLVAVFGNIRRRPTPPVEGRALQNVAVVAEKGRTIATFAKRLLPTYDVFDEARYFESEKSPTPHVFEYRGKKIGVTICEDIWNDDLMWQDDDLWRDKTPGSYRLYHYDPVVDIIKEGVDLVVNLSASPWAQGKHEVRQKVVQNLAKRHQVPVAYVNTIGANDGLIFDGQSMLVDSKGEVVHQAEGWQEALAINSLEAPKKHQINSLSAIGDVREALTLGVRDYFHKTGLKRAVIGLSGGIDSAVTAYLAVRALGKENVIGVLMPSQYSSDHSVKDAQDLAKYLGVESHLVPIKDTFESYLSALGPVFADREPDVTEENLQARTRGTILMGVANKLGGAVLCTGNKSEAAMGYATLYGDTIGALSALADLYKHQVYALARLANENGVVIPVSTIEKPPSAELRPGQKDEDSLPPYDQLDRMLQLFIEHRATAEEIAEDVGVELSLAQEIIRKVYFNEFKRQQLPPTLRVSRKAWLGRVYPIVQRFSE